jgi:hypothetical protein
MADGPWRTIVKRQEAATRPEGRTMQAIPAIAHHEAIERHELLVNGGAGGIPKIRSKALLTCFAA